MPVARIISSSFEDALKFADYLRPLFDTVEIAQPGRASSTTVDLEVNLQLCSPQEAWRQIAELSRQPEGEIIVAPGTLFAEDDSAEAAQEFEGDGQVVEAAIAAAAGGNGSGAHSPEFAGIVPESELNWLGRVRESLRQWVAVRCLLREIRQAQRQDLALEQKRQRQMALQFERERREREARELALARAAVQPPAVVPETQPEEELPSEESFPTQAEQEEAIRRGLFVEEILRRRAQEQAGELPSPAPEAMPEFQPAPEDSSVDPEPVAPLPGSRGSKRLGSAMALAGVTSVLLMAALVGYAHRRPASPVPVSVLQRSNLVEQKVPFGPASLPAPAAAPSAAGEAPSQTVLAVSAPLPERHSFHSDFRRVRVGRHEVDYVSDDVTVRHFDFHPRAGTVRHPAAPVPVTANSRGIKQISDME